MMGALIHFLEQLQDNNIIMERKQYGFPLYFKQ